MDVGDWPRGLGLGQYEAAFRESEIEADVLAELTDQHLKDLWRLAWEQIEDPEGDP
jgi:hypothetical protein